MVDIATGEVEELESDKQPVSRSGYGKWLMS
jgi:hypothetical protein